MEKREGKKRHYSGKLGEFSYANTEQTEASAAGAATVRVCLPDANRSGTKKRTTGNQPRIYHEKRRGGEKMKSSTHKNE